MSSRSIIFRIRGHSLWKLLHLNHLNKEKAIYVDRIINKDSDLFRLLNESLYIDNDIVIESDEYSVWERFDKCNDNWSVLIGDQKANYYLARAWLSQLFRHRAVEGLVSSETNRDKNRTKETIANIFRIFNIFIKDGRVFNGRVCDGSQSLKLWSFTDYYQETINSHRFLNTKKHYVHLS